MNDLLTVIKAIADESRVRALIALGEGELCVCQITELLSLAPSTVSKHMSILRHAGLVKSRKEGRWIYYSLKSKGASGPTLELLQWLRRSLEGDRVAGADLRRLKKILSLDPCDLCKIHGK